MIQQPDRWKFRVPARFERFELNDTHLLYRGELPAERSFSPTMFDDLWQLHPDEYHIIMMHGRPVATPRWQQAFGRDYHYTGNVNSALPVPDLLASLLAWCQSEIVGDLNGILVNWYDGTKGHYIGRHRDSVKNMVAGAPIVTVSFGEQRTFRLRPWKGTGKQDFVADDGAVFIMPYETNLAWTHEVPKSSRYKGRRISVTFRAFETN